MTEDLDWVNSFRGVCMEQTLKYCGTHGKNLTDQFIKAVERELSRYEAKPDLDAATRKAVRAVAARAITRARKIGAVPFEPGK